MQKNPASIVPVNESGASSDTSYSITLADASAAMLLFEKARQRLMQVNRWHEWSGQGSAVFQLTDEKGNAVDREVQLGDHFRIDIPAPGSSTGSGYDWVQVEAISDTRHAAEASFTMRVRPSNDPRQPGEPVAHFFSDDASSTFSVYIKNNQVTASVEGRNEKPNMSTGNLVDNIRNTVIATGAMLGLNKPQWKNLVHGLLA